jgi:Xaa-Pro aminopeptidase
MDIRIKTLQTLLAQRKLDCLLVFSPANVSYLTDFRSRDSFLFVSPSKAWYVTDSRYTDEARLALSSSIKIKKVEGTLTATIIALIQSQNLKRIGFEAGYVTFSMYERLKKALGYGRRLIATNSLVENLRQIKSPQEIEKIRGAIAITRKAFGYIKRWIKPGRTELEIAAELERFIRYQGAYGSSFDIIVASGPNASFPHHVTSTRRIRSQESVLIDMGVDYAGYKSDLTRMFFLGIITPLYRRTYDVVRQAHDRAINAVRPGISVGCVDQAARQYIRSKGYAKNFTHSTGHGVGLEVHEAPRVYFKETTVMQPGMVFTIEPALYLTNSCGIRLESMVLVTEKGCEVLSGSVD